MLRTKPTKETDESSLPMTNHGCFLYESPRMQRIMQEVRKVAGQPASVLLSGETGTGKTQLARVIHELSPRRDEPFLVVNCATLSDTLIESELFGHCKGAFTGADRDRIGKLAAVGAGTLLLDDIDTLSPSSQAKLLRAIDDRTYEQVGSNRAQPVKGRFIVASNRCLAEEASAGRFRQDLYYRLNVVEFSLPPLRERRTEIAAMAAQFVEHFSRQSDRLIAPLGPEVTNALKQHDWPGNIRELRNVMERGVALCTNGRIQLHDLPDAIRQPARQIAHESPQANGGYRPIGRLRPNGTSRIEEFQTRFESPSAVTRHAEMLSPSNRSVLADVRHQAEINRILDALEKHDNNRLQTARELGISRTALYKKLHKYGLMDAP